MQSAGLTAPAVERNRGPILQVLRERLPGEGLVLEVAGGTGEHAVWFSRALAALTWQPTDPSPEALASMEAWRAEAGPSNLLPPLHLDAAAPQLWPLKAADAVVTINMVHIAPWSATVGLMQGAGDVLPVGGLLYLYGPFREAGVQTAASNAAFDRDLQSRDPRWGVRDLEQVTDVAGRYGLRLTERIAMPANNLSLIFRKS